MIGFGAIAIGTVLIRRKHHATAFAIVLRHVKQVDDRLFESYSDKLQHIDSRNNLAALSSGNRLACHIELLRKLFLSESFAFSCFCYRFIKLHCYHPFHQSIWHCPL